MFAFITFLNLKLRIASITLQNSCGLNKLTELIIMLEFLDEFFTFINAVFELVINMPGDIPQRQVLLRDVIAVSTWRNIFRPAGLSSMAAQFWSIGHQIVWKLSQIIVVLNRNLPLHSLIGGIRSIWNWLFFFLRFVEFIGDLIFFLMWCMIRITIIWPKIPPNVDIIWIHKVRICWHLCHELLVLRSNFWLNAIIWNIFLINETWGTRCLRLVVSLAIRMVYFSPHLDVFVAYIGFALITRDSYLLLSHLGLNIGAGSYNVSIWFLHFDI